MTLSLPRPVATLLVLGGLFMLAGPVCAGQNAPQPDTISPPALPGTLPPPGTAQPANPLPGPGAGIEANIRRRQERMREKKAEQDLKKDTARLLTLAQQLQVYVDRTNTHILSLDVIKKTKEIEKLAKQIREKMQNGH